MYRIFGNGFRRHLVMLILAVVITGCGGGEDGAGGSTSGSGSEAEYDWTNLTLALDSFVGSGDSQVTGYSFALNIGGKTVYTRAAGNVTSESVIPIASASKAPAATAVLSLVSDGLLDLDEPISTYIGSAILWPSDKSGITMQMLLNHTSGIPFSSSCLSDTSTTLAACAQEIANTNLNFTPGAKFGYSGAGYQVAGFVAAQIAGKSWDDLFAERVTTPLAMSSFSYGNTQNPRIAGGASSNGADYLKFTQMVLDGGVAASGSTVLTQGQILAIQSSQIESLPVHYSVVPNDSGLNGYSFGWWISDPANHAGSEGPEISDPGSLGATPWLDFDQNYTAVLLINMSSGVGLSIWSAVRPTILDQIAKH